MVEEWKSLAIASLAVICGFLGWWGNVVWNAVKELREEHRDALSEIHSKHSMLELHLSENFVRKDDLKERLQEVMQPFKDSLDEIKAWMRGRDSKQ